VFSVSFGIISVQNYGAIKDVYSVLLSRACTLSKFNSLAIA